MAAKNDILRDKDGNQIFPATTAEQVSYDGKMNVKQAIKRGAVRNKVAPTVASMTDKEQIYIYTGTEDGYTFGNWYYWNGTAWTSGGAYNSIEVNTDETLTEEGAPADAKATGDKLSELKGDIANSRKAIAELADKKITKFYANSLGETTLNDSDNGKIQDMILYGKSLQDGTPTPDAPVEIQSVVNPVVKVCGKNLLNPTLKTQTVSGVKITNNGDGTYTLNGTATGIIEIRLSENVINMSGNYYAYITDKIVDGACMKLYYSNEFFLIQDKTEIYMDSSKTFVTPLLHVENGITLNNLVIKPMLTKDPNVIYDDYEPYKEQTETLPYTLNAIPVSSGGNVTIDGQQYIADYVDIEKKQLVRMVGDVDLGNFYWRETEGTFFTTGITDIKRITDIDYIVKAICNIYTPKKYNDASFKVFDNCFGCIYVDGVIYFKIYDSSKSEMSREEFIQAMSGVKLLYELETPTITDLTDEEVQAFKDLATYYPTTNVIVTSDQLDGYTTFNYPLSMANGWNLIKEQLGDTREYIYNMELQSAEAYVNSEYAVTLTELGV